MSSESDPQQYYCTMVSQVLAEYRSGTSSFGNLVESLHHLLDSFEESEWLAEFRGHWLTLEVIYSVALDRGGLDDLSREELQLVNETLTSLEELLG